MLTISTRFLPPTDTEGSKFGAIELDGARFTFVPSDYSLTTPENHLSAAIALIREHFEMEYVLISCDHENSADGYTWTFEAK